MISEVMRRGARIYAPTDEWNHAARCVTEMASRPVQILELAARRERGQMGFYGEFFTFLLSLYLSTSGGYLYH